MQFLICDRCNQFMLHSNSLRESGSSQFLIGKVMQVLQKQVQKIGQ